MTTVLRQPLKAVLGMLALLLAACGENHQQMVLQLEELERQNRADSLMLNDSLALHLADYFDRHGSANERLRAHYILGRTYADMGEAPAALSAYLDAADCADTTQADCDYRTLGCVYSQMGDVYYKQLLLTHAVEARKKSYHYALIAGDTLGYITELKLSAGAYFLLNKRDSAKVVLEEALRQYEKCGFRQEGIQSSIVLMHLYMDDPDHLPDLGHLIARYDSESNLFDDSHELPPSKRIYYYYKGRYLEATGLLDSAEYYYRKTYHPGMPFASRNSLYQGLLSVFQKRHQADSIAKYAQLYCMANDSSIALNDQQLTAKMTASYQYSRHQSIANKEHERAERERKAKNVLFLAVALALVAIGSIVYAWRRRKKAAEARYESIAARLKRAEGELANLHALEAEKTDLQALSDELYRQIAAKEAAVGHLQKEIAQLRRENVPQVSVAEQQLSQSDLYRRLHQSAKCEAIPEEEWQAIDAMVRNSLPGYHRFLSSLRYSPDSNEYRICLLLRLHIRMQDASGFIGISKSRLSQISTDILEDVFAIKGSGKELQKQLERME